MRMRYCAVSCDCCGTESTHDPHMKDAVAMAREEGWAVGTKRTALRPGLHIDLCPACRKLPDDDPQLRRGLDTWVPA